MSAPGNDMAEGDSDLPAHPSLREAAVLSREVLGEIFSFADTAAIRHQKQHRWLAMTAALCGTLAVLLAIAQLGPFREPAWPRWLEFFAAVLAAAAVIGGLLLARQRQWHLERHRAERCRLTRFKFLIDPALWCGGEEAKNARVAQLHEEARALDALSAHDLEEWLRTDDTSVVLPPSSVCDSSVLAELVAFYERCRLNAQIKFFTSRGERDEKRERRTHHWPALLFFASIVAALVHFIYDLLMHGRADHHFSIACIVAAAMLPVVSMGIRTWRSANESGRNAIRYRAKLVALNRFREMLQTLVQAPHLDYARVFTVLADCERIIESDHREWLRLMADAEWFG